MAETVNLNLILDQVAKDKGLDRVRLVEILEESIATAAKKHFGMERNLKAHFDDEKGKIDLFQVLTIVDDPTAEVPLPDPVNMIPVSVARERGIEVGPGDDLYHAALRTREKPTVILAQTKKGYGMGDAGQGRMTTHQQKKLEREDLIAFRNRFDLPLTDEQAATLQFYKPADDSPEMRYLRARRQALGGVVPVRRSEAAPVAVPPLARYGEFALKAEGKEMSTTMAFVRMLTGLLKDAQLGPRVVPIVADEARTFGMANRFKQIGIYSSAGQCYEPEDIGSLMSYREPTDGQIWRNRA